MSVHAHGTVLHELGGDPRRPHAHGAPVLLVHGLAADTRVNWLDTHWVATLQRAGFTVWSVDLPGHGAAAHGECFHRDGVVEDLARYAATITAHGVAAVGYSLGAQLLYRAAGLDPERFSVCAFGGLSLRDRIADALAVTNFVTDPDHVRVARQLLNQPFEPVPAPPQPAVFFRGADDAWVGPGDAARFRALRRRRRAPGPEPETELLTEPGRDHVSVLTAGRVRRGVTGFLARRTASGPGVG